MALPEAATTAEAMLRRAHEYARPLALERRERRGSSCPDSFVLAADQGHALRAVIACSADAIVAALLGLTMAVHEGPRREGGGR